MMAKLGRFAIALPETRPKRRGLRPAIGLAGRKLSLCRNLGHFVA